MAASGSSERLDVLIVGAGLSGIAAAFHLQARLPGKSVAVLEGRDRMGGTWDLFRYPGVRSDSDMQTLGYGFRPWRGDKALADGPSIAAYIADTARAFGIDRRIRYRHRVTRAAWSSSEALWTVEVEHGGAALRFTCGFLFMCSGYYDYASGHRPDWPGAEDFAGRIVHPQFWPADLDYAGRRVVVIGSGATAVTLVPAMAEAAAHVTMLQRSPTYVVTRPNRDPFAARVQRRLPRRLADGVLRWKNVLQSIYFYTLARRKPERVSRAIIGFARKQLGDGYDVARHFTPTYKPWDQRLCLVPDGDLFRAIRSGRASVATDTIERFTGGGIRLSSGEELPADIVVTATGLNVKLMGGMAVEVDGAAVDFGRCLAYKGMMFSGVPNFALALGYTNASWTLKCELTAAYVCRLLAHMDRRGQAICVPERGAEGDDEAPALDLTSGYVKRAAHILPKQGAAKPWRVHQNYVADMAAMRFGRLDDGVMRFAPRPAAAPRAA